MILGNEISSDSGFTEKFHVEWSSKYQRNPTMGAQPKKIGRKIW